MKRFLLLLMIAAAAGSGLVRSETTGQEDQATTYITGSRKWRMADGTEQLMRLKRFLKETHGGFQRTAVDKVFALDLFSKEEQEVFTAVKKGSIKLVTTPGLNMNPDFPTGKVDSVTRYDHGYWVGELRNWTSTDGRRLSSRLICLTDEHVFLLNGDSVGRVPLTGLGPADLSYIERLKRGEARMYPDQVQIVQFGWGNGPSHRARVAGERYAALAEKGGNFELALAGAMRHVSSKLDGEDFELLTFEEQRVYAPSAMHPPGRPRIEPHTSPVYYTAEFLLTKKSLADARRHWPYSTTSPSWPGSAFLHIYLMADGEVVPAEPVK
ncbi:MAG: hypothetical protein EOP88_18195 [Verrucomicrobiaceae bacterium]|nr:MAG: hypothetical protein EOP88_18195 [Verrucomicrobiaceae bacterium]